MLYQKLKSLIFPLFLAFLLSSCAKQVAHVPSSSAPNTSNKTAQQIYQILPTYTQLAKQPWPVIQPTQLPLKLGNHNVAVSQIRERLILLGDMKNDPTENSKEFDHALQYGVMQFQWRHGLKSNGIVNQLTLNALNITPAERYRELVASMNEWGKLPEDEGARYIHINIPDYKLHVIQNGQEVLSMNVIAGRFTRPTPILYSKVQTVVFNPQWNVPKTILKEDIIPGMQKNPNYLKEHGGLKIYKNWDKDSPEVDPLTINWQTANLSNFNYRLTAPPGDTNPLGRVKFIFENSDDVYMHDTPQKALFADMKRAYSSGCIRLEHPLQLVEYFYSDNKDLNAELTNQYLSTAQTKYIQLKNPMPIYVTYITASVDAQGHAHFREDVYRRNNGA